MGEEGDSAFVMEYGFAVASKQGGKVGELRQGTAFGELCALGVMPRRTATIQVGDTVAVALVVKKAVLLKALKAFPEEQTRFEEIAVSRSAVTNVLTRRSSSASAGAGIADVTGSAARSSDSTRKSRASRMS